MIGTPASLLKHHQDGPCYVDAPTVRRDRAQRSAIERMLTTFLDVSAERAVAALLDHSSTNLSPEELDRLANLIRRAQEDGP